MALYHLLVDYVFLTSPVIAGSTIFYLLLIGLQTVSPLLLMMGAIRRKNPIERFLLILFPMVFILTGVLMDVLLGGSFLHGGFHRHAKLFTYLVQSSVLKEVWVLLVLYPFLALLLYRWTSGRFLSLLCDLPVWGFFSFCLFVTVHLQISGLLPPLGFVSADTLLLWYVYGIFVLLFQVLLNLTAALWHLLFSQRPFKGDLDELCRDPQWCKRQVERYMLSGYRVLICSMLPLILFLDGLMVVLFLDEGGGLEAIETIAMLALLLLPMTGMLLYMFACLIKPSLLPALRKLDRWGNPEVIRRQFCQEFLDEENPPMMGTQTGLELSAHFLLARRVSLFPKLFYLPLLQGSTFGSGEQQVQAIFRAQPGAARQSYLLLFKDGTRFPLVQTGGRKDQMLVQEVLKLARQASQVQ